MRLIHSTHELDRVKRILQEGIRPSIETGIYEFPDTKDSKVICFTAEDDDLSYRDSKGWGNFQFALNKDWVKQHAQQFREHSDRFSEEKVFLDFVNNTKIAPYPGVFKRTYNQILSLRPVPLEGIEELAIPSSKIKQVIDTLSVPKNINLRTY